jgi:uncharacterized Fe-S center protein
MNVAAKEKPASRVWMLPIEGTVDRESLAISIENILNFRAFRLLRIFTHGEVVGVKPCLNRPTRSLDYVAPIVDMLRHRGATPVVCDTTDRFRDVNRNGINCMEELAARLADICSPIVILDGIRGEHELLVRGTDGRPDAHVAGELPSLGGAVLVSCARRDPLGGLSGALINLGAGMASKRGKICHYAMHVPHVHQDKCYACRRCLRYCPVGAIEMGDSHVVINPDRCINCGRCVEVARFGGISYQWDATPEHFRPVAMAHAHAAFDTLKHRVVCVTALNLVPTANGESQTALLFSRDPVAIDTAAGALLTEHRLLTTREQKLAEALAAEAEAMGLGRTHYSLECVAF